MAQGTWREDPEENARLQRATNNWLFPYTEGRRRSIPLEEMDSSPAALDEYVSPLLQMYRESGGKTVTIPSPQGTLVAEPTSKNIFTGDWTPKIRLIPHDEVADKAAVTAMNRVGEFFNAPATLSPGLNLKISGRNARMNFGRGLARTQLGIKSAISNTTSKLPGAKTVGALRSMIKHGPMEAGTGLGTSNKPLFPIQYPLDTSLKGVSPGQKAKEAERNRLLSTLQPQYDIAKTTTERGDISRAFNIILMDPLTGRLAKKLANAKTPEQILRAVRQDWQSTNDALTHAPKMGHEIHHATGPAAHSAGAVAGASSAERSDILLAQQELRGTTFGNTPVEPGKFQSAPKGAHLAMHKNNWKNTFLTPIVRSLSKNPTWKERNNVLTQVSEAAFSATREVVDSKAYRSYVQRIYDLLPRDKMNLLLEKNPNFDILASDITTEELKLWQGIMRALPQDIKNTIIAMGKVEQYRKDLDALPKFKP